MGLWISFRVAMVRVIPFPKNKLRGGVLANFFTIPQAGEAV
jgi:hypothetical protein